MRHLEQSPMKVVLTSLLLISLVYRGQTFLVVWKECRALHALL